MDKADWDQSLREIDWTHIKQTNSTHQRLLIYGLSDTEDMLKEFGNSITASMSLSKELNNLKWGRDARREGGGRVCLKFAPIYLKNYSNPHISH